MSRLNLNRHLIVVLPILLVAALLRGWIIASNGAAFESDEAIVGLMARHINAGQPIPTFYYGQTYMGSLDELLVALGFHLWGESVDTIRMVQLILYLLSLATGYTLAWEMTRSRRVAAMTLLILAIPAALGTLYTTISLGGYNELVLLGNIILLLGWQIGHGRDSALRWMGLGLVAGIGWWTNGAVITACATAGLMVFRRLRWQTVVLAALAFLAGSAPWWLYNLRHDWAALTFLTEGFGTAPGTEPMTPPKALMALLLLGIPALYGLRLPWEATFLVTPGALVAGIIYLLLITDTLAGWAARQKMPPRAHISAARWIGVTAGLFAILFIFSSFADATGRYLMPLWVPAAVGLAISLDRLRRAGWLASAIPLGLLLACYAGTVIHAAHTETGLTPQLVEDLRVPAQYDDDVLNFLEGEGYTRGYAGYWAAFRLIFRSHERVILDTSLPYIASGYKPSNNRYPTYSRIVTQADRTAWITMNFPELDAEIEKRLGQAGVTYQTHDFGPYRVYTDFSRRVAPADFDLNSTHPLN